MQVERKGVDTIQLDGRKTIASSEGKWQNPASLTTTKILTAALLAAVGLPAAEFIDMTLLADGSLSHPFFRRKSNTSHMCVRIRISHI
jgi:hypothetical protein